MTFNELLDLAVKQPARFKEIYKSSPEIRNIKGLHGESLFYFLAIEDEIAAAEVLYDLGGFDVDERNDFNDTALIDAAALNDYPLVEFLLKLGANPLLQGSMGYTALHAAYAYNADKKIKDILLAYGASSTVKDDFGDIPENAC